MTDLYKLEYLVRLAIENNSPMLCVYRQILHKELKNICKNDSSKM